MRSFMIKEMQARAESLNNESIGSQSSMNFWVKHFGASAAGWLIWNQRRKFRRLGAVDFNIPATTPVPAWFRVAIETLKRRVRWEVHMVVSQASIRTYRVRWLQWRTNKNKKKPALRLV